jgi:hypothetical protein
MAKKSYPTQEAAQHAADQANALAPGYSPEYVPWHFRDAVTGEQKWFIRRKPPR